MQISALRPTPRESVARERARDLRFYFGAVLTFPVRRIGERPYVVSWNFRISCVFHSRAERALCIVLRVEILH